MLSFIRQAAGRLLDVAIGAAERVIERIGDPDLSEAIERDRRAIRLSHDRLVEALEEIRELELLAGVQQRELEELRIENANLHALVSMQKRAVMRASYDTSQSRAVQASQIIPKAMFNRSHGLICGCPECKGETDGNQ